MVERWVDWRGSSEILKRGWRDRGRGGASGIAASVAMVGVEGRERVIKVSVELTGRDARCGDVDLKNVTVVAGTQSAIHAPPYSS